VKVGDLVRRKRKPFVSGWTGIVVKVESHESGPEFVYVRWLDDGTVDDCSSALMEVVSESR